MAMVGGGWGAPRDLEVTLLRAAYTSGIAAVEDRGLASTARRCSPWRASTSAVVSPTTSRAALAGPRSSPALAVGQGAGSAIVRWAARTTRRRPERPADAILRPRRRGSSRWAARSGALPRGCSTGFLAATPIAGHAPESPAGGIALQRALRAAPWTDRRASAARARGSSPTAVRLGDPRVGVGRGGERSRLPAGFFGLIARRRQPAGPLGPSVNCASGTGGTRAATAEQAFEAEGFFVGACPGALVSRSRETGEPPPAVAFSIAFVRRSAKAAGAPRAVGRVLNQ